MTIVADWLIGSARDLASPLTVNGSPQTVEGEGRYLYHPTAALSLLGGVRAAMSAAGVGVASATLLQNRKVRLSGAAPFSIVWGDSILSELLGFTSDLAASASYTADLISPLVWSGLRRLRPELSPRGVRGMPQPLNQYAMSPYDGTTSVVSWGTRRDQRWTVGHVPIDRIMTADNLGGEFGRFFSDVLAVGASFNLHENVTEAPASTSAASLGSPLGPWVYLPAGRSPGWAYRRARAFGYVDKWCDLDLSARDAPEYATA